MIGSPDWYAHLAQKYAETKPPQARTQGELMNIKLAASLAAYAASIIAANLMTAHLGLVPVGFGMLVTAGTFAAGFALLARDLVHRHGGLKWALVGILSGAIASWFLASPALAIASTVAFAGAELIDLAIFAPMRKRYGFAAGAIASNITSAPIDTALFLHLAGFGVTFGALAGQFVGKVFWATLIPLATFALARHFIARKAGKNDAVLRKSINA